MPDETLPAHCIVLLARNDMLEAMRVAAGLTIFGHTVSLVFMHRSLTENEAESEQAELLELADIEPVTTVKSMEKHFDFLDEAALGVLLRSADHVVNV